MRILKQFEPLVIHDFEEKVFHMGNHGHTYFEIGYICKGSGIHYINNSVIKYKAGDLFLLCPGDSHHFKIHKSTRFVFIKFTDSYFGLFRQPEHQDSSELQPTQIMGNRLLKERKLKIGHPNFIVLKNIIDSIAVFAKTVESISQSQVVFHLILSVIALAKESMREMDDTSSLSNSTRELLISYIHDHIYDPFELKIQHIAPHFNIAPKYFGAYFKRIYGMGYSEYVNKYKLSLIELRIQSKKFSIRQIAQEFGFTDESHLSRFFKRHHHISPGAYQKQ